MIPTMSLLGRVILGAFGVAALLLSVQLFLFLPLTLGYERWKRRTLDRISKSPFKGRLSVIVPAYNEEKTLRACVESVLKSHYPDFEIVIVNDGSTDATEECIADLVDGEKVRYLRQRNAGKATALNLGAGSATGDVLLYTDADSLFLPETIGQMARWFADPTIDAVCGNDTPLTTNTPLQKMLAVTTHIGTGFVRRALSLVGVLPVISGNLGAVRASTFREVGGFEQIWGEDLEFTFRLQKAKKRIIFDPAPVVLAECPAGLRPLWCQRVRWARSYLKVSAIHRDLLLPGRAFPFSAYLPFNYFAQTFVPLLQIISIPVLLSAAHSEASGLEWAWMFVLFFGLLTFLGVALYSVSLDRDFKTLRYIPQSVLLIVPLSYFYSFVVLYSVWLELLQRSERWEKIERLPTGAIGRRGGVSLVVMGALLVGFAGAMRFPRRPVASLPTPPQISYAPAPIAISFRADDGRRQDIAVATHFDGWQDWHDAVNSVLRSPAAPRLHTVGISAGRVEWAHFRWQGHASQWSPQQKGTPADMLGESVATFGSHGFRTIAMVDFYSPKLVHTFPDKAAVRFDGLRSTDEVCFTELVDGEYGRQIIEMVSYLANHYQLDAIALTELGYQSYCFDDRCLRSYHDATSRSEWPRKLFSRGIDRDDPSIWEWRSSRMEAFLGKVADAAHSGGKQLIVDVPVSWQDLKRRGKDSGLDYDRVLRHADQIVVWNYFGVEQKNPEVSKEVVRDLLQSFPPNRFYVSVGLWRPHGTIAPETLRKGVQYSLGEGADRVWITPNELMSDRYWTALDDALGAARVNRARN